MVIEISPQFRIEIEEDSKDNNEGKIFFYLNEVRFGNNSFSYELDNCLYALLRGFKEITDEAPFELFNLSKTELTKIWKMSYEDDFTENKEYSKLGKNFSDKYCNYDTYYTFDNCLVLCINYKEKMKLILDDDNSCEEVIINRQHFLIKLNEMVISVG